MQFARKAMIVFVSTIFIFLLFALPSLVSINKTIGNAATIKAWLKDSQIYTHVVDAVSEQANKSLQNKSDQPGEQNPLSHPEVKAAAQSAFSPDYLQSQTESVIDGTFAWLKGKTPKPEFQINITEAKQKFAAAINKSAKERYAALPVCTSGQAAPTDFDPFAVTCQTPGFDANAEIDKATSKLVTDKDAVSKDVITADDIKSDKGNDKPLHQKLSILPVLYRLNQVGIAILIVLILGLGTGMVFLYPDRRQGLKRVARKFLTVGVIILVGVLVMHLAFNALHKRIDPKPDSDQIELKKSGIYIADRAEQGIQNVNLGFGIVYLLLGAGTLVAFKYVLKPEEVTEPKPEKALPKPIK